MLINKDTMIIGKHVVLTPYRIEHVLKYHEWMKSPELQELTASTPLTLEEEYEMQQSWMNDSNKCTFIVLNKSTYLQSKDEIKSMIGDTNLFLNDENNLQIAEAEIMIAEKSERGKGYGFEAILLMLVYGINKLDIREYEVKISDHNSKSINLFKGIGFLETSRSNVFKEITFSKKVDENWKNWLSEQLDYEIIVNS